VSKEQVELDKARKLVAEVVPKDKEAVPNAISDDSGRLDPRFALWRAFCAEHGVSVESMPGDLTETLKKQWEGYKEKEIHAPEEGRS
jgi:hypothetical protein